MDGKGVKTKIDQTVVCANIWKAFGLGEIKDIARQSEEDGRVLLVVHMQTEGRPSSKLSGLTLEPCGFTGLLWACRDFY